MFETQFSVEVGIMAVHAGLMLAVIDFDICESYAARIEMQAIAAKEMIVGAENIDGGVECVHSQLTFEVETFEGTVKISMTRGSALKIGEDAFGERVDEIGVEIACLNV